MKKIAAALFLFISMAVVVLPASASSVYNLTLNGAGGGVDGVDIYPYTFAITGGDGKVADGPSVALMCIDFNREITFGESWDATLVPVSTSSTNPTATQLEELVRIYAEMLDPTHPYSVSEYQFAAWSIITPTNVTDGSYPDGLDSNAIAIAAEAASDVAHNLPFDYSDYSYFDPTGLNQIPDTGGSPQRFLVYTGTPSSNAGPGLVPTPEPSSLMLLGTGILGLAGAARRRFKA